MVVTIIDIGRVLVVVLVVLGVVLVIIGVLAGHYAVLPRYSRIRVGFRCRFRVPFCVLRAQPVICFSFCVVFGGPGGGVGGPGVFLLAPVPAHCFYLL